MTNESLATVFSPFQTILGLVKVRNVPLLFESSLHRVSVELMDPSSTLACDLVLKELPRSWVDAYSVIAVYHSEALHTFIHSCEKRSIGSVAEFIVREISGPCSGVFDVCTTSEWMRLHQEHLQSLRRRNDVFWRRVSGLDDGRSASLQATY